MTMAWTTNGISNEDMCTKLLANGVIRDAHIFTAFRAVDRGIFVSGGNNTNVCVVKRKYCI